MRIKFDPLVNNLIYWLAALLPSHCPGQTASIPVAAHEICLSLQNFKIEITTNSSSILDISNPF